MNLTGVLVFLLAIVRTEHADSFILGGRTTTLRTTSSMSSISQNEVTDTEEAYFSPDELISMTKDYLENPSPDWWSEDFVFRGPVIGPLCKKDLVNTLGANSDLQKAFPDLQMNPFGFSADDPIDKNRVWFFVRPRGTFTGSFNHPTKGLIEPPAPRGGIASVRA